MTTPWPIIRSDQSGHALPAMAFLHIVITIVSRKAKTRADIIDGDALAARPQRHRRTDAYFTQRRQFSSVEPIDKRTPVASTARFEYGKEKEEGRKKVYQSMRCGWDLGRTLTSPGARSGSRVWRACGRSSAAREAAPVISSAHKSPTWVAARPMQKIG